MNRLFPGAAALAALTLFVGAACSGGSTSSGSNAAASSQDTHAAAQDTAQPNTTRTNTNTNANTGTNNGGGSGSSAASASTDGTLTTAELVKLAEPSVVRIQTSGGIGSGFIVSDDGEIVTNNHVVSSANGRTVNVVQVRLSDGTDTTGRVVGTDPRTDLAVVKIDTKDKLKFLKLANLADVQIGDDVVAIGYALDLARGEGPSFSVTRGIVSQKNRAINESSPIFGAIQTDAAINHGNSGGPLLDMKGEVVGVNTSLVPDESSSTGVALGIGLSVGSDTVKAVYEEILKQGHVSRGLLGIQNFEAIRPAKARELGLPDGLGGILLGQNGVAPDGPAAAAGMKVGDVITKIAGTDIRYESDLAIQMIRQEPGDTVPIELYRAGKQVTVNVTLGTPSAN